MRLVGSTIALGIALVGFSSCAPAPVSSAPQPSRAAMPPPPPAPTQEEATPPPAPAKMNFADVAKATVPAMFDALNQHDAKTFAAYFTEGALMTTPCTVDRAANATGRAAIAAASQGWFDTFSSYKTAPSRVFVTGDMVVVEWGMLGTHSGTFHGLAATERPVGVNGVTIFFFDESAGLVREAHRYVDDAALLDFIGPSRAKHHTRPVLASEPQWHFAGGADDKKNEGTWSRALAAIADKKKDDFVAAFADTATLDDPSHPSGVIGAAGLRTWFDQLIANVPDVTVAAPSAAAAVDDFVVSEITFQGTAKASKKTVAWHVAAIAELKDGKIATVHEYGDDTETKK